MFIPAAETLLSKGHKTCQIVQQNQETAQILRQTRWHLLKASYQSQVIGHVALFTLNTSR